MRSFRIALCVFLFSLLAMPAAAGPELRTIPLSINGHKLTAEVAINTAERTVGLMHRFSLKPDHGMLFVRRVEEQGAFWMKNTFIALSIAFIDPKGRILDIQDMAPQTEDLHQPASPYLFALEMKKGWFREHNINPGDVIAGLNKAPKAED